MCYMWKLDLLLKGGYWDVWIAMRMASAVQFVYEKFKNISQWNVIRNSNYAYPMQNLSICFMDLSRQCIHKAEVSNKYNATLIDNIVWFPNIKNISEKWFVSSVLYDEFLVYMYFFVVQ
jgi:hypothetical protein